MDVFSAAEARKLIDSDRAVILECGSNDGADTQAFLDAFPSPDTLILCFECDRRAIERWQARIHDPRAILYPAAVGEIDGFVPFHPSAGSPPGPQWIGYGEWDKSGSLLPPDKHSEYDPWLRFNDTVRVPCYRLDTVLPNDHEVFARIHDAGGVDVIWSDLQGFDAAMLRGAQAIVSATKYVYAEIHHRKLYKGQSKFHEVQEALPGFCLKWMYAGDNFLFRRCNWLACDSQLDS